jgi:hypothetical protein
MLAERDEVIAIRAIAVQQNHELARLTAGGRHQARSIESGQVGWHGDGLRQGRC